MRFLFLCLFTWPLIAQSPLLLQDVLGAVEKSYPPLLTALAERTIADGDVLQALGKFDLVVGAQLDSDQFGYYPNERGSVGFDQALSTWGASAYGGYRLGDGKFAPYDGKLETRSLGEWRAGVKIPLLRNRQIDERRGTLQKSRIGLRIADLTIEQQRLAIRQLATRRYWDWVAAGHRLQVARDILRVAQERDQALREAANLGQIAAIEVTENQRQILQRRSQLVESDRGIQQASIELSLFYRNEAGEPVIAASSLLPVRLPETATLTAQQMEEDGRQALLRRPEIMRLEQQRQQTIVDQRLADNDRKPSVDLSLGFTAEGGEGTVRRGPNELKASLRVELPFQRRAATGKAMAAEAKLQQIVQRERFAKDQVEAEVRDAGSAVQAAHERTLLAKEEVAVALELADAERERFRLGDSTLFTVNLREQAAVDAELREVNAVGDYLRALTVYEQVTVKEMG